MTVSFFILIVIAVLPPIWLREKWSLLLAWLWITKILLYGRNLYVDAWKSVIYDPEVSIYFFGLNYQNGCERFWTYGFLKLKKDDEIIWYFQFPNNCCHSLSVCTGYMELYLCSHSIFVLTCKYYTLCVNVFHFWHWILVTIAFQTLVLDKFTLALNWQWNSLLL